MNSPSKIIGNFLNKIFLFCLFLLIYFFKHIFKSEFTSKFLISISLSFLVISAEKNFGHFKIPQKSHEAV